MGKLQVMSRCPGLVFGLALFSVSIFIVSGAIPVATATALTAPTIAVTHATVNVGQNISLYATTAISGGTAPYSCQWLQKAPNVIYYSGLGLPFPCSIYSSPSTSSPASSPTGAWRFELQVTDNASLTAVSNSVLVTVNPALATPVLVFTPSALDTGQVFTSVGASWSGGSAPYSARLYRSATSSCNASSTAIGAPVVTSALTASFTSSFGIQTTSYWYCAVLADSAAGPALNSTSVHVIVSPYPSVPSVFASAPSVDLLQTVTLSANFTGGAAPYTCQWLVLRPGSTVYANLGLPTSCSSSPSMSSGKLTKTGIWDFKLKVTDGGNPHVVVSALSPAVVLVNPVPKTVRVLITPNSIPQWQQSNLTATIAGGTAPYSCQWRVQLPATTSYVNLGHSFPCSPSSPVVNSTGILSVSGSYRYRLLLTDSSGTPYTATSLIYIQTVYNTITLRAANPSASAIDIGQYVNFGVSWSGGKPAYVVRLYNSSSSSCSNSSTLLAMKSVRTASTSFLRLPPLSADTWYCATVTDGSVHKVTIGTPSRGVVVNPLPTTSSISLSASRIDLGQGVTMHANFTGGTAPFTCQWLELTPGSAVTTSFLTVPGCDPTHTFSISTGPIRLGGTWTFTFRVTDSSHGPVKADSPPAYVIVNQLLAPPTVSTTSTKLDSGQSVNVTVSWIGGTAPFSIRLYSSASSSCGSGSTFLGNFTTSSSPVLFTGLPSLSVNTWYCATATDILGPSSLVTSSAKAVQVSPMLAAPTIAQTGPSSVPVNGSVAFGILTRWTGGVSPYTCQWLVQGPNDTGFSNLGSSFACTLVSPISMSGVVLDEVGTWQFELAVTDSSGIRVTVYSAPISFEAT